MLKREETEPSLPLTEYRSREDNFSSTQLNDDSLSCPRVVTDRGEARGMIIENLSCLLDHYNTDLSNIHG